MIQKIRVTSGTLLIISCFAVSIFSFFESPDEDNKTVIMNTPRRVVGSAGPVIFLRRAYLKLHRQARTDQNRVVIVVGHPQGEKEIGLNIIAGAQHPGQFPSRDFRRRGTFGAFRRRGGVADEFRNKSTFSFR